MDDLTGPLPPDVVKIILVALQDDPVAHNEFTEGLGKHLHYLSIDPSPENAMALARFGRRWLASIAFEQTRREALEEADQRTATGDLGTAVTTSELRELLGR